MLNLIFDSRPDGELRLLISKQVVAIVVMTPVFLRFRA